jgi:hypothetical protein
MCSLIDSASWFVSMFQINPAGMVACSIVHTEESTTNIISNARHVWQEQGNPLQSSKGIEM